MEKKSGFVIIVIVFLSILVGLLGGYVLSNELSNKNQGIGNNSIDNDNNKQPSNNQNNNDEISNGNNIQTNFTLDDARNLMNRYKSSDYLEAGEYYFYEVDNEFAKNIFSFDKLNGSTELSCEDIFGKGYENSDDFSISACGSQFEEPVIYSYDEVLSKKKYLFGSSSTLKKESISDKCLQYTYVENINSFAFLGGFCGGDTSLYSELIVDNFEIDNEILKIYSSKYVYEETKLEKTIKSIHYFKKEKDNWYLYDYKENS